MKKIASFCFVLLIGAYTGFTYENNMPNLVVPSNLDPGSLELGILHRLYDPLNAMSPNGIFAGGASVNLGLRLAIWNGLEADVGYSFNQTEVKAGLGYTFLFPQILLRLKLDVSYVNYKDFRFADKIQDVFPLLALQSEPLFGFLTLDANLGYDAYNLNLGAGAGLDFLLPLNMHFLAECIFPINTQTDNGNKGNALFFSAAYKIEVDGHHFLFTIANSPQIDIRRLMLGAESYTNWYFGFTIQRLFSIYEL